MLCVKKLYYYCLSSMPCISFKETTYQNVSKKKKKLVWRYPLVSSTILIEY